MRSCDGSRPAGAIARSRQWEGMTRDGGSSGEPPSPLTSPAPPSPPRSSDLFPRSRPHLPVDDRDRNLGGRGGPERTRALFASSVEGPGRLGTRADPSSSGASPKRPGSPRPGRGRGVFAVYPSPSYGASGPAGGGGGRGEHNRRDCGPGRRARSPRTATSGVRPGVSGGGALVNGAESNPHAARRGSSSPTVRGAREAGRGGEGRAPGRPSGPDEPAGAPPRR